LTGHLFHLRPPDRGYFPLPKEPEWEYARTGRRDPLEGVGPERAGRRRPTAVRRLQGVLVRVVWVVRCCCVRREDANK
jgi:hypothetical protein